jgi:hypothetical protein
MNRALVQYFFLRSTQLSSTQNYLKDTVQKSSLLHGKRIALVLDYTSVHNPREQQPRRLSRLSADIRESSCTKHANHVPKQADPARQNAKSRATNKCLKLMIT